MKNVAIVLAIVAILGGAVYFTQNKSSEQAPSMMQTEDTTGMETKTETMEDVTVIEMEAGSFYYTPNVITAKKGEKIRIVMKSVSMMHDFVIDELGVKMPVVKDGDTGTVEFVADKVGSFEYYCSVGQHRANGQIGTITITE